MSAVDDIRDRVNRDGIGESVVDYYGRELTEPVPEELRKAWADAYDALARVNELLEVAL